MGWGFIVMCFALALGFHVLDLLFSIVHPSSGMQNAVEIAYTLGTLIYMAKSLALAIQIIFGRRSPMH